MKFLNLMIVLSLLCTAVAASADDACDAQAHGAAGLCNAYCDAMDCDGDPNANATACEKVKEKWQQKTGETPLPCEEATCPCDDAVWQSYLAGVPAVDECVRYGGPGQGSNDLRLYSSDPYAVVSAYAENEEYGCFYSVDGETVHYGHGSITAEEHAVCMTQIAEAVEDQGLVCEEY